MTNVETGKVTVCMHDPDNNNYNRIIRVRTVQEMVEECQSVTECVHLPHSATEPCLHSGWRLCH